MIQYINKDTLAARIKKLKMDIGNIFNEYDEGFWEGRATAFDDVICALNNLEVKEVNLKKEVEAYLNTFYLDKDLYKFAKHFYELGLNVRKEE